MSKRTIPEYGASIAIEDCTSSFYLREKALDAIQEQVRRHWHRGILLLAQEWENCDGEYERRDAVGHRGGQVYQGFE